MVLEKILCKYIKYKFIFNNYINKSSYKYQKLFRSIYGYNQLVYKKNSKKNIYYREGVVSKIPYIKPGKNSIILPNNYVDKLLEYFETGNNPTHNWRDKGDWKVKYEINNVYIDMINISNSVELFIKNYKVLSSNFKDYNNLIYELNKILDNLIESNDYILYFIRQLEYLFNFEWIKKSVDYSEYVKDIYNKYLILKNKYIIKEEII